MKTFYLHFNRIEEQRESKRVWTVHVGGRCIQASRVIVNVPIETVYRGKGKSNPRALLKGKGNGYWVRDQKGESLVITSEIWNELDPGWLDDRPQREKAVMEDG